MHVYYIIYQDLFFSVTHLSLAGVLWQCIFLLLLLFNSPLETMSYLR